MKSGNIGSKLFSSLTWINFFLIPLFAATPPATINDLLLIENFLRNSLKAIFVLTYKISSIVFWNEAAKSYFSFSVVILFVIFNIAVLRPAKDKLHPPLFIIGLGKLNLSGSPFSANFSNLGPPGNSIPKSLAVLSNASPKASSIVVPNLV